MREQKSTKTGWLKGFVLAMTVLALPGVAFAQTGAGRPEDMPEPQKIYSPYVQRTTADSNLAEGVYWGDTHLHTSYSTDAGMFGNTLGPEEAYRFARGEEVLTAHGLRARLIRPLDFLVVSDHAENLGLAPFIAESNPELLKSEWGRNVHDLVKSGNSREAFQTWITSVSANQDPINNPKMTRTAVQRARPVHRIDRIRMDLHRHEAGAGQPAPGRHLQGRQRQGGADPALQHVRLL
jgi:hypothetical protein